MAVERNVATVAISLACLDTRNHTSTEKRQQPLPMKRRTKLQTKQVFIIRLYSDGTCETADLRRSLLISLAERAIEPTHTPETGGHSYLAHWQISFVNEFLS